MTQIINNRFSYSNPPNISYPAVTDWHIFDDGERIPITELVDTANQQEAHIASLLAEIQRLTEMVPMSAPAAAPIGLGLTRLSHSPN